MIKIRLMRIGSKKRPFYRVVAVDERKKRTGGYLELLGTYNPLTNPKEINLNTQKIEDWVKKGAILSDGFLRITGKAPQRPPRKAKKAQPEPKAPAATATPVENPSESTKETSAETTPEAETPTEETPVETAEAIQDEEVIAETATIDEPESNTAEAVEEEK